MTVPPEPSRAAPPEADAPAVAPVHDFARKLRQAALWPDVVAYVGWQRARREARAAGAAEPAPPARAPLSINLDLTTACNHACTHCIDWDTLNSGVSHDEGRLRASLETLVTRGLRSVILIGGGEPTVYPGFAAMVGFLKGLGLQVAVVTNGSRPARLLEAVEPLDGNDWIRLSLDAGSDATFQAMHRPRSPITLEAILAGVPPLKARNPAPRVGFSFVITWRGARRAPGAALVENLGEIVAAARLAREHGFDYVSFKPFLVRADDGAEVMDPASAEHHATVLRRIRDALDEAKALATPTFQVLESTNLRLLESGAWRDWTRQPHTCHLQAFRQVLSPLGTWNCPAHRGVPKARLGDRDAYAGPAAADDTARALTRMLDGFDASHECREVTCLYHATNWWLEALVDGREELGTTPPLPGEDLFL